MGPPLGRLGKSHGLPSLPDGQAQRTNAAKHIKKGFRKHIHLVFATYKVWEPSISSSHMAPLSLPFEQLKDLLPLPSTQSSCHAASGISQGHMCACPGGMGDLLK